MLQIIKSSEWLKADKICILHEFHKPPWGGGNQFLLALKKQFEKRGIRTVNKINFKTRACLFNSFNFNFNHLAGKTNKNIRMVHRVDGPTFLVRGKDREIDDKVFSVYNKLAETTVFQSSWSLSKAIELGYEPVNPVIIPNAVDLEIFNKTGKQPFSERKKIRLISSSWSDNIRKGYPFYKWMDEHLDWSRFEYTFLGRVPGNFTNIRLIPPQPSQEVGEILKEHDIYIVASKNEPCSNALLEALSCGLPALYLNSGSHKELVKSGGLGFDSDEEILPQLEKLVQDYKVFQDGIVVPSIEDITDNYLALLT